MENEGGIENGCGEIRGSWVTMFWFAHQSDRSLERILNSERRSRGEAEIGIEVRDVRIRAMHLKGPGKMCTLTSVNYII